jgi:hypothetical protein
MLDSGYAHDDRLSEKEISWEELPQRVHRDLVPWLAEQRRVVQASGKETIDSFLRRIPDALG